jgi:hypothetical protein
MNITLSVWATRENPYSKVMIPSRHSDKTTKEKGKDGNARKHETN